MDLNTNTMNANTNTIDSAVNPIEPNTNPVQSSVLQVPQDLKPKSEFPGLTPVASNTEYHAQTTDLISYDFPDSTNIVNERYTKYAMLVKTIEGYAEGYASIAAATIKQLEHLNNDVTNHMPNFESNELVSGSAVADVNSPDLNSPPQTPTELCDLNVYLSCMRKSLGENYSNTIDFQNQVQSHILPDLKRLLQEIEKKQKDYVVYSSAESKDLTKLRDISAKACQTLDANVQEFDRGNLSKNRLDYKKDPYLIKKTLLKDAVLQIRAENKRIEFLANAEESLRSNEARFLNELKRIFALLTQLIGTLYGNSINSAGNLNNILTSIPDNLEWNNFLQKNSNFLVTAGEQNELTSLNNLSLNDKSDANVVISNSYKRQITNITFRNNDHLSTRPLLEGVLSRKETTLGIAKKYISYYFAISPAGYFYGFPTRSIDSTQPNLILYIPDCETKNMHNDFKFSLRGKDISSSVGALKLKKTYVFKASSENDFDTWWKVISSRIGSIQTGGTTNSDISDAE